MPRAAARGGMATGDRGVARRAKTGGFDAVPLGFATDAPRGSAGSFTYSISGLPRGATFLRTKDPKAKKPLNQTAKRTMTGVKVETTFVSVKL